MGGGIESQPMSRLCAFLLWLLMLAVPLQGYAAASMAFCGPVPVVAAASASGHDHAAHGHDPHAQPADDGSATQAHQAQQTHHADDDSTTLHKCGTCGACHASALTSSIEPVVFRALPQADLADPFDALTTVPPRLLDKPPRA